MALLHVEALTKSFGGLVAVKDLSFDVEPSEIVALIGPNGAGKTTVFNLLSGFERADAGRIVFDGREITSRRAHEISSFGLARTFQITKPFAQLSAFDNVLIGCLARHPTVTGARVAASNILDELGLSRRRDLAARHLNVPERKRLEVARAISIEPKLVLLDEVMAGINAAETRDLMAIIQGVRARGIAVLVIEHVMRAVMALAERVVVLNYGVKIAEGRGADIARDENVIEAYLGRRRSLA